MGNVKTTLEIDDQLYREAKAVAALSGRKIKDLVAEGLRHVLKSDAGNASAVRKLEEFFARADVAMKKVRSKTTAREELARDRNRSEKA